MKILHAASFAGRKGGIQSYVRDLSVTQGALGHEVSWLDLGDYRVGEKTLRREAPTFDVVHLHMPVSDAPSVPTVRTVHGHDPYCPSGRKYWPRSDVPCPIEMAPVACGVRYVTQRCGSLRPRRIVADVVGIRSERRVLREVLSLAVSKFVADQMMAAGHPGDLIRIVPNTVPASTRPTVALPIEPSLLYAGRLEQSKGVHWLIESLVDVPDLRLDVAGTGSQQSSLRELAARLGVAERVRFHGWCEASHLESLYDAAWAVVVPSLWLEPAGLVALEAMGRGRAIVAADAGGLAEFAAAGEGCIGVAPGDRRMLATALADLTSDRTRAEARGDAARRWVTENRDHDIHVSTVLSAYADACGLRE